MARAFQVDLLTCAGGGRVEVIAAVQDPAEIRRFLVHLKLLREPGEIVAIRGPPEDSDPPPPDEPDEWDALDELTEDDWAA